MTKISSVFAKLKLKMHNRQFLALWFIFHGAILAMFSITFICKRGNLFIDADLMNMLPGSFDEPALAESNSLVADFISSCVYIMPVNKDFEKAKETASYIYEHLKDSENFTSFIYNVDVSSLDNTVEDFLMKYRWNLLDEETSTEILNGGDQTFAENALAKAYGALNMTSLESLDQDPFLIQDYAMNKYLTMLQQSGTSMSIKDGVLAAEYNGYWYVLIQGSLSKQGAALASKKNAVTEIYDLCNPLENDSNRIVYAGIPFQSHKNSLEATIEIKVISAISLIAVIIILFLVFRSTIPILFSVISIGVSLGTAIATTLAVFGKLHILTLIFGTSLIGSCIDYSLHFFVNWKANTEMANGSEIRNHLIKGLLLSVISTILCYVVMMFTPYNLIKQMGLFSIAGLASSFLTTVAIYPYIKLPTKDRKIRLTKLMEKPSWWNKKLIGRIAVAVFFVLPSILVLFLHKNASIYNRLDNLYTVEGRILNDELEFRSVVHFQPFGWFIVQGDTAEETLEREEELKKRLDEYRNANGEKIVYLSTSTFIPSEKTQRLSKAASAKLLENADLQMEYLGYDSEDADLLRQQFESTKDDFLTIEGDNVPDYVKKAFGFIWAGQIDGKYYSLVVPTFENNPMGFRKIAEFDDNVFFAHEITDVSENLDRLTRRILYFLIGAFFALFAMLIFVYKLKHAMKIISIPFLIILLVYAIFSVAKIHLEFFSIIGVILVLGLGLDYIIYMIENENRSIELDQTQTLEPFAILLSFVTTAISFGALAFSNFVPVHMIGLSIFIGLTTAYFGSFFYDRS